MKKLSIICLILVIALGSIGAAYAGWSQNLTIGGSVSTGSYDAVFTSFSAPSGSFGASFTAVQVDTHTYTVTCTNLYPGLDAAFDFVLENSGTIPGRISDVKINGVSVTATGYQAAQDLAIADGRSDITVQVQNITAGSTLSPGQTAIGRLMVHTWISESDGNDATAAASGSFTLEIETQQQ